MPFKPNFLYRCTWKEKEKKRERVCLCVVMLVCWRLEKSVGISAVKCDVLTPLGWTRGGISRGVRKTNGSKPNPTKSHAHPLLHASLGQLWLMGCCSSCPLLKRISSLDREGVREKWGEHENTLIFLLLLISVSSSFLKYSTSAWHPSVDFL